LAAIVAPVCTTRRPSASSPPFVNFDPNDAAVRVAPRFSSVDSNSSFEVPASPERLRGLIEDAAHSAN
jgi:hypothetical protein